MKLIPLIEVTAGLASGALAKNARQNGAGAMSAKVSPIALLILQNGHLKLINVRNQDIWNRLLDMIPDAIDRITGSVIPRSREAEAREVLDEMVFMPVVNLHKEGAEDVIDGYLEHMKPKAFELVFDNDGPEVLRLIKKVRESGAKVFINSLWPELCGGHDDDRAVELGEPEKSWGWIVKQGAKLIQTDRSALLLDYLEEKGLRE